MNDATVSQAIKAIAALDLLRFKAAKQMCKGKDTFILDEEDIQEVLFVAGMKLDKEVEVI